MKLLIIDEEFIAGGVETLRLQLLPELARRCESVTWVLSAQTKAHFAGRFSSAERIVIEELQPRRGSAAWFAEAVARRLPRRTARKWERILKDRRLRRIARDGSCTHALTTCVFNQGPFRLPIPFAGFVCDVNPVLPEATKQNMLRWVRTADAIFGISEFTCAELRRLSPDQSEKIHSVPLAAPRLPSSIETREEQFDFFLPAAPNAHKGHIILLMAVCELVRRGADFRLALSGPGTNEFRPGVPTTNAHCIEIQRILERHSSLLQDRVMVVGELVPERVSPLFASSRCVVLPSSYEGFGLPLVEALLHGRAVICSDIPAFREQLERYGCFDRVRLVPPGNVAELIAAMDAQLHEPAPDFSASETRARLSRWTWPNAADRCIELLNSLT